MILEGFAAFPFLCVGSLLVLLDTLLQARLPLVMSTLGMPKLYAMSATDGRPPK